MFFLLSKLFWAVAAPLNLCALLLFAGGGLIFSQKPGCRRLGLLLTGAGLTVLLCFGILPVGSNLLAALESRYPPFEETAGERIDGILLLGGAVETRLPPTGDMPALNDQADRVVAFVELARRYPRARLLVTGGSAGLERGGTLPEALLMPPLLSALGLEGREILYEPSARNTYENAILSRKVAKPKPGERWILVTSAFHMPRSVAVFESAGWAVVPAPTDYRTDGGLRWLPQRFDVLRAMEDSTLAVKEGIGLAVYRLSGKIASPAPDP